MVRNRGRDASYIVHLASLSMVVLVASLLGSCQMPAQGRFGQSFNLKLLFLVQGQPKASATASTEKLLLPTALSLTVTLTPLDSGLDIPAPQTVPINTTQKTSQSVPVSFSKLAAGRYSIEAVAKDGSGNPVFRQTDPVFSLSASSTAVTLNLVPVVTQPFAALATAQPAAGSLPAGTSTTWMVPPEALSAGGYKVALAAS